MRAPSQPPPYTAPDAMRLHILLVLICSALAARAATIHSRAVPDLEKKLTEVAKEVLKDDKLIENQSSEQELIDQVNTVADIENNLRNGLKDDKIPVKVVMEDVKISAQKNYGIEKGLDVVPIDSADVKRAEIDLKNPGPPQRQEHDTQTPEDSNSEQEAIISIKQKIADTQNSLKKGLDTVKAGLKELIPSNNQVQSVQQAIVSLQESFAEHISQLNSTLQANLPSKDQVLIEDAEKGLKIAEKNFDAGVEKLSKGLLSFASGKQGQPAGTDTAAPGSNNPFGGLYQSLQQSINQLQMQFSNFQQNFQNFATQAQQGFGGSPSAAGPGSSIENSGSGSQVVIGQENVNKPTTAGSQADTPNNPDRPSIGQGIQNFFQGLWPGSRPGAQNQAQEAIQTPQNVQADQPAATASQPGPFVQAIQNNPIVQGVVNLIQRPQANNNKPAQSAKPVEVEPAQEGLNAVPEEKPAVAEKPVSEEKQKPVAAGPIQQIVQRNPIVQGIAGVAQRIQNTVANPEKPRENERGHWSGASSAASEHSDVSNGVDCKKDEPVKEDKKEELLPPKEKEDKKEESLPPKEKKEDIIMSQENNAVSAKTE